MSFFTVDYEGLDEVNIGSGTRLRLAKNVATGKTVIQSWSFIKEEWLVMYRHNVDAAWTSWKNLEASFKKKM